jgi:hypothetical protein
MKEITNPIICDTCGEIIQHSNEGMVEWLYDDGRIQDVYIVHHLSYSPDSKKGCSIHRINPLLQDAYLANILNDQQLMDKLGLVRKINVYNMSDFT